MIIAAISKVIEQLNWNLGIRSSGVKYIVIAIIVKTEMFSLIHRRLKRNNKLYTDSVCTFVVYHIHIQYTQCVMKNYNFILSTHHPNIHFLTYN